jgi:hypothetical protein
MVAITAAKQGQFLTPVPATGQNVESTGAFQLFSTIFSEILISPDIGLDRAVSMSAINFFTRFWGKAVDNF